jgi:hypothetical protein
VKPAVVQENSLREEVPAPVGTVALPGDLVAAASVPGSAAPAKSSASKGGVMDKEFDEQHFKSPSMKRSSVAYRTLCEQTVASTQRANK